METSARYVLVGAFMLAAIAGAFAFVYWLHAFGGLTERTVYRVQFDGPVAGLLVGGPVLFNGIRVGEVTGLQLSPDQPAQVTATMAINPGTPVRRDTRIAVESQGLLGGSSAISLIGGTPASAILEVRKGEVPLLLADAAASRSMTETAREALRRLDGILADNSQSLHGTIENLSTFTAALARNSDRIDGIVTGLERMVSPPAKPPPGFDLTVPSQLPRFEKTLRTQLVVAEPTTMVAFDTQKILIKSDSGERSALENAQWSDSIPKLFQARIINSFEDANFLQVGRSGELTGDVQLLIDIRSFQIVMSTGPVAEVEFSAKLVSDGRVVQGRIFHADASMPKVEAGSAAAALDAAFGKAVADLLLWAAGLI